MVLIGLTGAIGHGKSSLAEYLAAATTHSAHLESSRLITEVANELRASKIDLPKADDIDSINAWLTPLPKILLKQTGCKASPDLFILTKERLAYDTESYQKLFEYFQLIEDWPALAKGPITPDLKNALRPLLQWIGGYCVKNISGIIWFEELVRRAYNMDGLELATIGGLRFPSEAACLKTVGAYIVDIVRPKQGVTDGRDITERERTNIKVDIHVSNDGTIEQLESLASKLYEDLLDDRVKARYKASDF